MFKAPLKKHGASHPLFAGLVGLLVLALAGFLRYTAASGNHTMGVIQDTQTISAANPHSRVTNGRAAAAKSGTAPAHSLGQAPVIVSAGATIVTESCSPANGAVDPGETVTVSLCAQNTGSVNTTNLVGTLAATGGVSSPSGPQNYGVLTAGGPPVCRNFTFTASGTCGGTVTATVQFQDGATNLGDVTYTFTLGVANVVLSENFDGVTAPALPAGWTTSFINGDGDCTVGGASCGLGNDFTTTATGAVDTAPNAVFHNDPSCVTDNYLVSPSINITTASAQITFRNNFNLEDTFDGAVLEVSSPNINGGDFTDITNAAVGGSFVTGGYTDTISTNFLSPLGGRQAWSGNSGGYITTTANLGPNVAGQTIVLRFRFASDCSVSGTAWRIDTVQVTDGYNCCTNPCPNLTCPANITASNDPNQCGAVVNYPAPTPGGPGCGTISCSPPSGSFFPTGTTTVNCTSTAGPTCSFTVTVQDAQVPTITCPANITRSNDPDQCGAVVNYPPPTSTDNCPGVTASCSPASGSFFPTGTTAVTCTATDASNNTAQCSFTITVNDTQAPAITCPASFSVGTTSSSGRIVTYPDPTVSDNCPGAGAPVCSPASGSNFPLGATTVTCATSDAANNSASCSFTVSVSPIAFTVSDPLACTGPGNVVTGSFDVTNLNAASVAVTATVTLPAGLLALPGTCTSDAGTCSIVNAATVTYSATLAAGQTATVSYQAQIGDLVTTGTQLCSDLAVSFGGGPPLTVQACLTVNCPPVGPGNIFPAASETSDQRAGSVLVYNLYSSDVTDTNRHNTRLSLTNIHPVLPATVHLFFVEGASCSVADSIVCLTPNQTTSFLASDIDPGTSGYMVAVAVDGRTGCPVDFNYLIGDEYVKLSSGHAANLGAEMFAALAGGLPFCNDTSTTVQLNFDGISYSRAPRVLAADNVPSRSDGNDTLLVVNRLGGSLATGAATLGPLFGIVYDDAERASSFSISGGCQLRITLSNASLRTTPRFETFIPTGRSGWLKLFSQSDIGLLGAVINFNANAGSTPNSFNQGRNLHKLGLSASTTLTIPVFPPSC